MVDFILFSFCIFTFGAGWWCGKTFKSFGEAVDAGVTKVKGWFAA